MYVLYRAIPLGSLPALKSRRAAWLPMLLLEPMSQEGPSYFKTFCVFSDDVVSSFPCSSPVCFIY